MELLNRVISEKKDRPIKVLQFGEGNFLRGFVDYMIDIANEKGMFDGDIVLVKPIAFGDLSMFREQDCQYTVSLRGLVDGKETVTNRIVTSVADVVDATVEYQKYSEFAKLESLRFIVSNTTEAGIVYDENDRFELEPPNSYPGKLTKFLYERYEAFKGDVNKGLIILPVELIDDNGIELKKCVVKLSKLWNLEEGFLNWLNDACIFCSTLVDRIITGYPREEASGMWEQFGYQDNLIVTGEPFALWVIESEKEIKGEFPLDAAGLPVVFTDNQKPYKQRKVRILNGAHTSFVLASYLAGNDLVLESMNDDIIRNFMNKTIFDEVIPTLSLPKDELEEFAKAVTDRFLNPFIKHALLSISLNSVSKWRARCMPSFLGYVEKYNELPKHLTFSLAALIEFYSGTGDEDGAYYGERNGEKYKIMDDKEVLDFFASRNDQDTRSFVKEFLSNEVFFGQDLTQERDTLDKVTEYLNAIKSLGMREALKKYFV